VRSVGVQGDSRTYKHPVLVFGRGLEEIGWSTLKRCAAELVNTLHTVNRVVYSPGDPPPWERRRTFLSPDTVYTLQKVDDQAQMLTAANKDIWQFPVIALPLYDIRGGQFFVLRPVTSMDAMTADVYEMRGEKLNAIIDGVRALTGAGHLLYDITTKPPSTIEWE
jgi:GMP synthase (glutamine-hydrolysing)